MTDANMRGVSAQHDRAIDRASIDVLVEYLIGGQVTEVQALVEAWIERGTSYEDIAVRGIQPAMYRIGDLWAEGRVSITQERLATAISHRLLVRAFDAATFAPRRHEKAVFACVDGNLHSLGLRIVSDTFAIAGWDAEFLGADVPTRDLVLHVELTQPRFLGLSVSLPEHVETANAVVRLIHAHLGPDAPRIVIGGTVVRDVLESRGCLAAQAWPGDASEALARA